MTEIELDVVKVCKTYAQRLEGLEKKPKDGDCAVLVYDPPQNATFALRGRKFGVTLASVDAEGNMTGITKLDKKTPFTSTPNATQYVIEGSEVLYKKLSGKEATIEVEDEVVTITLGKKKKK